MDVAVSVSARTGLAVDVAVSGPGLAGLAVDVAVSGVRLAALLAGALHATSSASPANRRMSKPEVLRAILFGMEFDLYIPKVGTGELT